MEHLFTPENWLLLAAIFGLIGITLAFKPKRPKFSWPRRKLNRADEQMRLWRLADGDTHLQTLFGLRAPVATYTERDYDY